MPRTPLFLYLGQRRSRMALPMACNVGRSCDFTCFDSSFWMAVTVQKFARLCSVVLVDVHQPHVPQRTKLRKILKNKPFLPLKVCKN